MAVSFRDPMSISTTRQTMPCEDKLCLGKEVGEEDCVLGVRKPGKQHKNPWKVAENVFHPCCWLTC